MENTIIFLDFSKHLEVSQEMDLDLEAASKFLWTIDLRITSYLEGA
jgi:hypothetical protein